MPPETKLGKPANRTAIMPLSIVRRDGGIVPRTSVLLQRVYPLVYHSQGQSGPMTPKAHASALRGLEVQTSKARLTVQTNAVVLVPCKALLPQPCILASDETQNYNGMH